MRRITRVTYCWDVARIDNVVAASAKDAGCDRVDISEEVKAVVELVVRVLGEVVG